LEFLTNILAPLALYGYGSIESLRKLPYRVLKECIESVKDPDIQTIIERKLHGRTS